MKKTNVLTYILKRKTVRPDHVFILLWFALILSSCTIAKSVYTKISDAEKIEDVTERQTFVNDFSKKIKEKGSPYIEGNTAYFVYEGEAESVSVAGDMSMWRPDKFHLKKIPATSFWYLAMELEKDARLDYKLVIDGNNWIEDPLNPIRSASGFGFNSALQMPDYQVPWEISPNKDAPKGTLQTTTIESNFTKKKYDLNIFFPPNFSKEKKYPTVYFQDGADYLNMGTAQTVIENLWHKKLIQPFISIFVSPTDREQEYVQSLKFQYVDFFVKELVPFIDGKFPTQTKADARAIIGDSYGGSISARISFMHPDIFGKSGWHSCALWTDDFELSKLIRNTEKLPIQIASVWGKYEGNLTGDMQKVSKVLEEKGYDIFAKEYNEGHSWGLWQATFDDILVHLFPASIN